MTCAYGKSNYRMKKKGAKGGGGKLLKKRGVWWTLNKKSVMQPKSRKGKYVGTVLSVDSPS